MNIQLLLTGNELMAGDTIDSNSAMIADFLGEKGWRINRKVTLGDDPELLRAEIEDIASRADVLLINGGLGPTVDDLTAQVLAGVNNSELVVNQAALAHLERWCEERGIALNDANRKQALLPAAAEMIANPSGSAVGIRLEHRGCLIMATPGVPSELRAMMRDEVLPLLVERFASDHIQTRRLVVFGLGESSLQHRLSQTFREWPENVELGFRASMPVLEVKLTVRNEAHNGELDEWEARLREVLGHHLLGLAPTSLAKAAIDALNLEQLRVVTAESCTGGQIAAQITAVPGASSVFEGGFVTYSNAMKREMLGVDAETLTRYGAVSEQVATEMAAGALRRSGADIAVAVTGIAGPEGGTEEKPVGTVWLAWGRADDIRTHSLHVPFGREMFQTWVSAMCLDLVRRTALGIGELPRFLERRGRL